MALWGVVWSIGEAACCLYKPWGARQLPLPFMPDKATRDFGYQPRFSAEEAFKITLEWLKTQEF